MTAGAVSAAVARTLVSAAMAATAVVSGCGGVSPGPGPPPSASWNRHVTARPVRATIADVLGTTVNALGGATRSGGWYTGLSLADQRHWVNRKVVSGADQKRLVPPPATWAGVPVFVEVDNVAAVWMDDNRGVLGTDQDTSANVCMVGQPRSNLTCIHVEIDGRWKARGWAPPDFPLRTPIDVQGYVYWDNPHESEGVPMNSAPSNYILGHYETGWEIHPVSAWRPHRG
jgi:hypothetical protein